MPPIFIAFSISYIISTKIDILIANIYIYIYTVILLNIFLHKTDINLIIPQNSGLTWQMPLNFFYNLILPPYIKFKDFYPFFIYSLQVNHDAWFTSKVYL